MIGMTSSNTRRHLSTWLLLVYVSLVLGGQGLHAVPGLGHDAHDLQAGQPDEPHGAGTVSAADHVGERLHDDSCPVCQFFSRGQSVAEAPLVHVLPSLVSSTACGQSWVRPQRIHSPYAPRAPPLSA